MSNNYPVPVANETFDPFDSASNPTVQSFQLFGMVEINAWACALVTGQGKVPYDASNPDHKRYTAIDIFIQPLPEIEVKNPKSCERHWIAEFPEWSKITLKSIKEAGIENVREINGKWAQVEPVANGKKYTDKNTGEERSETTFKFIKFFADENECRAAYFAAGGKPLANQESKPVSNNDSGKQTNYAFLKVIVGNAVRGKTSFDEAQAAVEIAIKAYPSVAEHYNHQSPETVELINQNLKA